MSRVESYHDSIFGYYTNQLMIFLDIRMANVSKYLFDFHCKIN